MSTLHLRSIQFDSKRVPNPHAFPFTIPAIANATDMQFHTPVTLFVGENGSGKSTWLSAIAVAAQSIVVGGEDVLTDPHLEPSRMLANAMRLTWNKRTRKGFFLRAEDFITFMRRITDLRKGLEQDLADMDVAYEGYAHALATMPLKGSLQGIRNAYGEQGLEVRSHGEGFMDVFQQRVTPGGLYLLDEPETPLSPVKQLAFMSMLMQMEANQCQFIIATHSPILLAYPGATIYSFDEHPMAPVAYDTLEHVNLTRDFLNHPEQFLRHLKP